MLRKGVVSQVEYESLMATYCNTELHSFESNRLMAKYAIAFLRTVLARESGYQNILTPGYALTREQYIEFFVTEKRNPNSISENWPSWPDLKTYFMHQPGSWMAKAAKRR
jgi:hypothetical protein